MRLDCFRFVSLFALLFPILAAAQTSHQKQIVPLNSGWEFRQLPSGAAPENPVWRPAQVPGSVHLDLLHNNLIPDPYYRDNEAKLQWIEDADWEYRTTLQAPSDLLARKNIDLVFEGLDAYAEVYLNEKLILTADNMFREWRVPVKALLKPGANQLHIVFPSPIKAAAKIAAPDKWREQTHVAEKTYLRKAAFEYGWDWGPRFVTSGIWRPARIEAWDAARISNLHIAQLDVTSKVAHLSAQVEVIATEEATAKVTVDYTHAGKKVELSRSVELHAGINHVDLPLEIASPQLWFPAGYGAQPLYLFNAQVQVGNRLKIRLPHAPASAPSFFAVISISGAAPSSSSLTASPSSAKAPTSSPSTVSPRASPQSNIAASCNPPATPT